MSKISFGIIAALMVLAACADSSESLGGGASTTIQSTALPLEVNVVTRYPHDQAAFTQGLLWFRGKLFESTGLRGSSTLRRVDLKTGAIEQKVDLLPELFGEGLARVDTQLFQLTYKAGVVIVYDLESFQEVNRFTYGGEGWGLCFDGRSLFMSDGSATLTVRDPATFNSIRRLNVRLDNQPMVGLNELECAEGWVYANIYQTNTMVRIDRETGEVRAMIDASGLLTPGELSAAGVLNGIAYKSESGVFLLTGKNWPSMFEVELTEVTAIGQ